jgi:hypothetical protein
VYLLCEDQKIVSFIKMSELQSRMRTLQTQVAQQTGWGPMGPGGPPGGPGGPPGGHPGGHPGSQMSPQVC